MHSHPSCVHFPPCGGTLAQARPAGDAGRTRRGAEPHRTVPTRLEGEGGRRRTKSPRQLRPPKAHPIHLVSCSHRHSVTCCLAACISSDGDSLPATTCSLIRVLAGWLGVTS
eukprot:gene16591-biopygen8266